MRWLVMRDNRVVNVVVWDGDTPWAAPEGTELLEAPAGVGVGFTLADGEWVAPPPPVYDDAEGADEASTV